MLCHRLDSPRCRPARLAGLLLCAAWLLARGALADSGPEPLTIEQARTPLKLLAAPEVQAELGLRAAQVQTLDAELPAAGLTLWQQRDVPAGKLSAPALSASRQVRALLDRTATPAQLARLDQLTLRWQGWQGLQLPSVLGQLQLDAAQQQSYTNFLAQAGKLSDKSSANLSRREFEWIRTTLTPAQRQRLKELLGAPFDFSRATIREVKAPELREVEAWINSAPLTLAQLRGKVVVVNFWTFGCINCVHNLPHYRSWYASFPRDQVVQIGIHTPETAAEHDLEHVKQAVRNRGLEYPIAVDNQRANWTTWGNNVWPAVYLVDKQGYVRCWWYGELNWQGAKGEQQMRRLIQRLLAEPAPSP